MKKNKWISFSKDQIKEVNHQLEQARASEQETCNKQHEAVVKDLILEKQREVKEARADEREKCKCGSCKKQIDFEGEGGNCYACLMLADKEAYAKGQASAREETLKVCKKAIEEQLYLDWASRGYSKYHREQAEEEANEIIKMASESLGKKKKED